MLPSSAGGTIFDCGGADAADILSIGRGQSGSSVEGSAPNVPHAFLNCQTTRMPALPGTRPVSQAGRRSGTRRANPEHAPEELAAGRIIGRVAVADVGPHAFHNG